MNSYLQTTLIESLKRLKEELELTHSKNDPRLIQEAKKHPNGWVYVIDEQFRDKDEVPAENIVGAWKVDSKGEIAGDFIPNPNYKK